MTVVSFVLAAAVIHTELRIYLAHQSPDRRPGNLKERGEH